MLWFYSAFQRGYLWWSSSRAKMAFPVSVHDLTPYSQCASLFITCRPLSPWTLWAFEADDASAWRPSVTGTSWQDVCFLNHVKCFSWVRLRRRPSAPSANGNTNKKTVCETTEFLLLQWERTMSQTLFQRGGKSCFIGLITGGFRVVPLNIIVRHGFVKLFSMIEATISCRHSWLICPYQIRPRGIVM